MSGADIAIVGMSGRFPGASDLDAFWGHIRAGRTQVRDVTPDELGRYAVDPTLASDPAFVPAVAPLDDMEAFDAAFFGYTPREAERMDPQQRVFLEAAWAALEDAGVDPARATGPIGVFAGATTSTYLLLNLGSVLRGPEGLAAFVENAVDSLASRVAYELDLRGPAVAVQSACSTSLVAVHQACQSLLAEECDVALAGGVSINLAHRAGYRHVPGSIGSPSGACRPFDASADGTVFGSGVGVVVLKRLGDAVRDGDAIRAVIRGSAVNNDGARKAGFTAPSVDGQAAVIAEALALAGVSADQVGYVEAHGTGTAVGDPIEVEALGRAFRASTSRTGYCGLGSLKGLVGHLDVAAGVAGLCKVVLALQHRELPPSAGFTRPNPRIDFGRSPVFVVERATPWTAEPRLAGVSAFGIGGTNAHLVVEEAPARAASQYPRAAQLLVWSARTDAELPSVARRLAARLRAEPGLALGDVAYTLAVGRRPLDRRAFAVARTLDEAVAALEGGPGADDPALSAAGARFVADGTLDPAALFAGARPRRVALPTYPFARTRHWIGAAPPVAAPVAPGARGPRPDGRPPVPPRTELESWLVDTWEAALGLAPVGVHDDLFWLGGDSLLATRLAAAIRERWGVELSLDALMSAPTVAGAAAAVAAARPAAPPPSTTGATRLPCTAAQRSLLFFEDLHPGRSFAHLSAVVRARGALDVDRLERAILAVVARHDALRTTFDRVDGVWEQQVHPSVPSPLAPPLDLRSDPLALADVAQAFASAPFDLARGPMLRARVVRTDADEHHLLLTVHHLVADGVSLGRLTGEIAERYAGREPSGPAVPFSAFVAWQAEWLSGERRAAQVAYWTEQLAGVAPVELPTDRPRPPVQSHRGAMWTVELPAELVARVRAFARHRSVTPYMTLLTAFYAVLHRHTGQVDLTVGSPISNRHRAEHVDVVGYLANTLALRIDLGGRPTFAAALDRVRQRLALAHANQDLPFEDLVDALDVPRDPSRSPVFQVLFAFTEEPIGALQLPGVSLERLPPRDTTARVDLSVWVSSGHDRLRITFDYATDLFDADTIERLAGHWRQLLGSAIDQPDARLSDLPMVTAAERAQLDRWNDTAGPVSPSTVVHRFRAVAAAQPDAVAVALPDGSTLTYRGLDQRSDALAAELARRGVRVEDRVALMVHRDFDLVVGALGVWKAGAAYVPLDPDQPTERLARIVETSAPRLVVTQRALAGDVPPFDGPILRFDQVKPAAPFEPRTVPDALAYVLFTSGSTGAPKGVAVEHRTVDAIVQTMITTPGVDRTDRVLGLASLAWDVHVPELYLPLVTGGSIGLVDRASATSADTLMDAIRALRVTVVQATPSTWRMLAAHPRFPELRLRAWSGAEALPDGLASALVRQFGAVWNLYGPTEASVWSAAWRIDREHPTPLLGLPLANEQLYVLDAEGAEVPIGVTGELYIGGAGVARGYFGRADFTAERFVPDPRGPAGARMYRTGDLVVRHRHGALSFVGRADHQVKVRGYRVELGEIEAALQAHPEVVECVVITRRHGDDDALVGYYAGPRAIPPAELHGWLGERLPAYMVPAVIAHLPELPRNSNGKLDRKALPEVTVDRAVSGEVYVAPDAGVEATLADLFAEVLRVDRVGLHDDFFRLGGHSLLATQLWARIQDRLGVQFPLRALFDHPTVAGLVDHLGPAVGGPRPVAAAAASAEAPLSFAQRRLWFIDQLEPGSAQYNIASAVRIAGRLVTGAMRATLERVIERHEVLRTTFEARGSEPVQVVNPVHRFELPVVDLSASPDPEGEARARCAAEALVPFDLRRAPVLRAVVFRLGADDHVLSLTVHHVAADGWSLSVLLNEVAALYPAMVEGRADPLPPLPLQYREFAARQRTELTGPALQSELAFWTRALAGAPTLELPTDRPRPPIASHAGASVWSAIPAELLAQVDALAHALRGTRFLVLLAAFDALLARYTGASDVSVGTPVASRIRPELEPMIGFFVNMLVLRVDLGGQPTFREVVARARAAALDGYAHQQVPFEQVVEAVGAARDRSRHPLFQVMFTLDVPLDELRVGDLRMAAFRYPDGVSKFDLTVFVGQDGTLRFEYATALFDAATIERLCAHFLELLAGAVADPDGPVSRLRLSNEGGVVPVAAPARPETTLAEVLRAEALRVPDAPALTFGDATWSYRTFDRRVDALAAHLQQLGVGPEVRVGVCALRSFELVVALHAIVRAGGAYVPLDPEYPEDRLAWIVRSADVALVLSASAHAARFDRVVSLDALDALPDRAPALVPTLPESLAYVIYTSGSTGRPKGAMNPHRAIVNRLAWMQEAYPLDPTDVVLQKTTFAFDVSVWELFWPLCVGARLVVAGPGDHRDPARLVALIERHAVTTIHFVPSMLAVFLAELPPGTCRSLRRVICSGEALPPELRDRFFRALPGVALHNLYGPTECAVDVTAWTCTPDDPARYVPIGRPIANVTTWVLDPEMQLAPPGVAGELFLGGVGVGRGYLGRPDLTAERFVPDPFCPGGVLYRTGDRARMHPDGVIEYLGRLDHQVKLRGNRIELGEIEVVLGAVPGVREAAAAVRGDRLLAWVVGDGVDPAAARAFLATRLPEYMVPSDVIEVDAFPLSPNGKLDRGALPEPSAAPVATVEPRTPTESAVARIWREVLQRPVGVHDDFFASGGHSLLAVQVVSRIDRDLGLKISLGDLFDAPTVARLAERLTGETAAPAPIAGPPPAQRLSHAQRRLWFLDRLTPGDPTYNVPVVLRLRGPLDPARLEAALARVIARHEALRTTYPERDGAPELEVAAPGPVRLEVEPTADVLAAVAAEVARPFDLRAGPVVRARLWALAPQDHVLTVVVHHIATDGWSSGIVLRELGAAYGGDPLDAEVVPFSDHARWEREVLEPKLSADLEWWASTLRGVPALELPLDRPRAPSRSTEGATVGFEVPADLLGRLNALCVRTGSTPYLVLFAVFASLLHRITGQSDVCVGTTVSGRVRPEVEGTVGCFVNTVAVRADLSGDPSLFSTLARVRSAVFGAWAHQDVPFDRVVEVVQPARDPSRTPLFQVLFSMNVPEAPPAFPGLDVELHAAASGTAKFDLTLVLDPGGSGVFEYATALFDRSAIERLAAQFVTLLRALLDHPDRPIGDAPLLSDRDRAELVALGTGPALPASRMTLVDRVRSQVARTPDAVAVVTGVRELTYAELDAVSDRWARHLAAAGAGPGTFVGIAVSRGPALVPAVLAALKSGAAYVPLDPAYPAQRLGWMIEDAAPVVIVTERALAGAIPGDAPRWCVEDGGAEAGIGEAEVVPPGPDDLAYLIYTSGSTGRPKAVEIAHRNAVARIEWAAGAYSGHELAGVLAATSLAFDLSVFELFAPLCTGGAVIVARDALALPELPARDRVRLVNTVPSAATELVRLGLPRSVRTVNLAGEALPIALVHQLYAAGVARVVNLYGPSEDTTYSTGGDVPRSEVGPPSIGRPLPGTRAVVVDAAGRMVPRGVVGELWLSGVGLARGYHHQAAPTAERFGPDRGGERVYRTGDLVRWRSDGTLAFLGRSDHQVKLRGFRIELGEVESALRSHPGVRGAVAAVRDGRLVAWVAGDALDVEAVRGTAAERLPEVMVPTRIAALAALPLTPNGKVDRSRLPEIDAGPSGAVPPRTEAERAVARIWSEVLGVSAIGVTDDFFALGGNSLQAVRVVSRIRDGLGVELPVRALFESPTVAAIARRLTAAPAAEAPIPRVDDDTPAPLSFAQERLWFLDRLEPGQAVYNLPIAVRVRGALDVGALVAALGDVVERHEVLRTRLVADGGPPVQQVDPPGPVPVWTVDRSAEPDPWGAAVRDGLDHAGRPFDLAADAPVRVALVTVGPDDHLLGITVHHAMADGGSLDVLRTDLDAAYRARASGSAPELPPLSIRYRDWARWQRSTADRFGEDLRYWQERLRQLGPIPLPTDFPRPPSRSGNGAVVRHPLPAELTARVDAFAEAAGATRFVVWLAAFHALLHRWSGATDLAVGTPIANRSRAELEPLIGLFVNTVVTRVDLGGDPGFRGVVARVRDEVVSAFAHAEAPFERVVEVVQPARDPSRTPLFQVLFAHVGAERPTRLGALALEPVAADTATAKFDLSLFVSDDAAAFEFDTALFDPRSIAALGQQLERLVRAAIDQPTTPVSQLPVLGPDEREALLTLGRGPALPPADDTLVDRFRAQVARTPDAVAVIAGDERWTYAALDADSDRLAERLAARGAGPGTFVGVAVHRGRWLVPAVLGALKSGAAYVPLDPAYPRQRLGFVVDDAAPIAVLVESSAVDAVPAAAATLVRVDVDDGERGVPTPPASTDLAYLIYTSGSTGRPKAVAIEHRAALARITWAEHAFDAEERSGVLAATSLAFDLSVFELFAPLCTGGTAIVARDALALPELPARDEVRLVNTVPSAGIELVKLGLPPGVRTVNLAGEALPGPLVDALYAAGVRRVCNLYGPSEDTTYSTAAEVGPGVAIPPIGRPLPGTRAYVVDAAGELVPAGAVGELWLAGDGQSRGYHGRAALTAERYVPDPYGPPGSRAYRTGDRVRWSPDGSLVYLGRSDHQVKVRGFRIELGEVEVALRGVPGVAQAVAGVRGGALIGWVVGAGLDEPTVRSTLAHRVPAHLVPSRCVVVPSLPLTPNGKVDRERLPEPGAATTTYVAPESPAEQVLADIWQEVLGVARIGVNDDFFALGGHSLLLPEITLRLRRRLGVEVPIRTLLHEPRIAVLALSVEEALLDQLEQGGH